MDIEQANEIIHEHLRARGIAVPPPPTAPVIDPLARRLSDVLRDDSVPEIERVRLRQIVSLVLADRRAS